MKFLFLLVIALSSAFADDFISGTQKLSKFVYSELIVDNNDNVLVSPFSLETVIALAQSGAVGETATEIHSSLHFPDTKEETETEVQNILSILEENPATIAIANKVFVDASYSIKDDFKITAKNIYQASVISGKEENVVDLANYFSFRGTWSTPFKTQATYKRKFYVDSKTAIEVDTMYEKSAEYNYAESKELDAQILELPFTGDDVSTVLVLPNKKEGILVLEKKIDKVLTTPNFNKVFVQVTLPKFKIASIVDLSAVLQKLGVKKAFNAFDADFSAIAGDQGDLHIGDVKQQAVITVSEAGVNAPFTTETVESPAFTPIATKVFTADHPFVFYIKAKGVVLVEGRVLQP